MGGRKPEGGQVMKKLLAKSMLLAALVVPAGMLVGSADAAKPKPEAKKQAKPKPKPPPGQQPKPKKWKGKATALCECKDGRCVPLVCEVSGQLSYQAAKSSLQLQL